MSNISDKQHMKNLWAILYLSIVLLGMTIYDFFYRNTFSIIEIYFLDILFAFTLSLTLINIYFNFKNRKKELKK